MTDVVQLAKTAREQLATALNALQNSSEVPEELMEVADPIAEAMSVFHRIERSNGAELAGRAEALANVRGALDRLQRIEAIHPAVDAVMEAVAASLSKAHSLARYQPPAAAPAAAPRPVAPAISAVPAQPVVSIGHVAPAPAPDPAASIVATLPAPSWSSGTLPIGAAPAPAPQPVAVAAPAPQPIAPAPQLIPVPDSPPAAAPQPASQPIAAQPAPQPAPHQYAPQPQAYAPAPAQQAYAPQQAYPSSQQQAYPSSQQQAYPSQQQPYPAAQQAAPAQQAFPSAAAAYTPPVAYTPPASYPQPPQAAPAPEAYRAPAPSAPEAYRAPAPSAPDTSARSHAGGKPAGTIVVELGTRSSSNFYKGLAGNDVIEHGGIFVATYKIPKIGSTVDLHVLLPGNYEFHASALVQWVREPRNDSTEPGFGARFVDISSDGRQLVYRYARNREPLFYDDL